MQQGGGGWGGGFSGLGGGWGGGTAGAPQGNEWQSLGGGAGLATTQWQAAPSSVPQAVMPAQKAIRVELHIACEKLVNLDLLSKTDPMVVVSVPREGTEADWREMGRTEIIWDNLDPKFIRPFVFDYHFHKIQPIRFDVYNINDEKGPLSRQDFVGSAECRLGEVLGCAGQSLTRTLFNKDHARRQNGSIVILAEEINDSGTTQNTEFNPREKFVMSSKQNLYCQFVATHLDKKDWIGKSDPFFVIKRSREGSQWVPVHKSEVIKNTLNPDWKPFSISIEQLNNGDPQRPLLIEVWDWNRSGSHEFIGSFTTTQVDLLTKKEFPVINSTLQHKKGKSYTNSGVLKVVQARITNEEKRIKNPYYGWNKHSFLEYIGGGCQINLIVAVDWTGSNGDPKDSNSLHYIDRTGRKQNEYMEAIRSVGSILGDYDADKRYPLFGFGGKNRRTNASAPANHCFALNGNEDDAEVHGIDGIMSTYASAFEHWRLSGPTHFNAIIHRAATLAREGFTPDKHNYQILLILTDGVINDMADTTREIVQASDLPLSIVIVGVGAEDFSKMEVLDADDTPLVYKGKEMDRDIVQFVPFREFRNNPQKLAEEVLSEIPWQLTSFFSVRGVEPFHIPRQQAWYQGGTIHQQPHSMGAPGMNAPPPQSGYSAMGPPQPTMGGAGPYPPQSQYPAGMSFEQFQQMQYWQMMQAQQQQAGYPPPGAYPPQQGYPQQGGYPSQGGYLPSQSSQPMQGPQQGYLPQAGQPMQGQPQQSYPLSQPEPSMQGQLQQHGQIPQGPSAQQAEQPRDNNTNVQSHYGQHQGPPQQDQPTSGPLDAKLMELLTRLGYLQYVDNFVKESLTYEALLEFSRDDLKELGLPAGPRIALHNALHKPQQP
eukprot:TRINITY_DN1839_c0_g1_i1.p1 TRINITY_DN1839_c0_g1~~TRINITY_DN1839_c0_g1_i1.p1  ORF type:complete len:899 (-),score=122.24 TRINITY_DN1839_c0_g1_i1:13-2649(-)